ncbi:MAG: hypothetical protein U1E77_06580 [Inhella sp.]
MAAVLEPAKVGELMRALDGYHGQPTTRAALLLSALLFQRPGNIRASGVGRGGPRRRPVDHPCRQDEAAQERQDERPAALGAAGAPGSALLRELQPLTGAGRFVFPRCRAATSA